MIRFALLPCLLALLPAPGLTDAPPGSRSDLPVIRVANVTIEAPWTVDPGAKLEVAIAGASGGRLEIWGPLTQHGRGNMLAGGAVPGSHVPITAPKVPGSYELRYLGSSGELLAQRSFEVAAVPIRLWLPLQLGVGAPGEVRWRGPARPGDAIQIVDPATGTVVSEVAAEGTPGAENVTMIPGPPRAGQYALRYVSRERGAVLRVLPITVGPTGGATNNWMRVPISVTADERFQVRWYGPASPEHLFQMIDPASGAVVASARGAETGTGVAATMKAPRRAGKYRMRFVDTAGGRVLSSLPFTVN
jgi:hypothetical protein